MSDAVIYHMCKAEEWAVALGQGRYAGSSQDQADGFIHFSTRDQVWTSAAKHRRGQPGILLLSVDAAKLGNALKWEPSRGGQLFPHLYAPLDVALVIETTPLPLGQDGVHEFPEGFPPPPREPDAEA
ncbi:MAG: DUF952 domain-containing protein [Rhodospirillales bacterium]